MNKKITTRTILLSVFVIFCFGISILYTTNVKAQVTPQSSTVETQQAEDEENLDKVLQVFMALPKEMDENSPFSVMALGVRVGKAIVVKPTNVSFQLLDSDGFVMADRKIDPNNTDPYDGAVDAYNGKIYRADFNALNSSGDYAVRASMQYIAPWGERISGSTTKEFHVGEWFNITNVINTGRDVTKFTINQTFSAIADFTDDIGDGIGKVTDFVFNKIEYTADLFSFGVDDPSQLNFFPIYLDSANSSAMQSEGYSGPDGEPVDPDSNFDDFVKSLDALVDRGIPFDAYVINETDKYLDFCEGVNNTDSDPADRSISNENPRAPGRYLSFHPEDGDVASNWVSGSGYNEGEDLKDLKEDLIPYRNVVVNTYENWFPIASNWTDYQINVSGTYKQKITHGDGNWNATRWIKHLVCGLTRNNSMFYNINGKPLSSMFGIDTSTETLDNTYDIESVYNNANGREGLTILNDFCLFRFNDSLGKANVTADEINGVTMRGMGRNFYQEPYCPTTQYSYPNTNQDFEGEYKNIDSPADFYRGFFGNEMEENVNTSKGAYLLDREDISYSAYNVIGGASVGVSLSSGPAFGFTSINDTAAGFKGLHSLYYKTVGDAVWKAKKRLIDAARDIEAENITKANRLRDQVDQMEDAWRGTEEKNYEDELDLAKLNILFQQVRDDTIKEDIGYGMNKVDNYGKLLKDNASKGEGLATETDDQLDQAGSDTQFFVIGQLVGGAVEFGSQAITGKSIGQNVGGGIEMIGGALGQDWSAVGGIVGAGIDWGLNPVGHLLGGIAGKGFRNHFTGETTSPTKQFVEGEFDRLRDIIPQLNNLVNNIGDLVDEIKSAINQTLGIIRDLAYAVEDAFHDMADVIRNVSQALQDIVDWTSDILVNATNKIYDSLSAMKQEIGKAIGFYSDSKNTIYKMISKSEIASGVLRYASEEFGVTEEVFFKELDVLKPMSYVQSGDSGLYVTQLGTEVLDEIFYVCHYKGELIDPNDINGTYQVPLIEETGMEFEQAVDEDDGSVTGLYTADFELAPDRDVKTQANVYYEGYDAFTVERTTKIEPSLQPDAYPDIIFDPSAVKLRTGENYLMKIGVDNLMYSQPNVTVRAELISTLGNLVGLREAMMQLNPEGEDPVFIDLEARIPFYVPPGLYTLVVKIVEDNGDVTRMATRVEVSADNFIFGLIGSVLSIIGIGVILRKRRRLKNQKRDENIIQNINGITNNKYCSIEDIESGKCAPLPCDIRDDDCHFKY